MAHLDPLFGDAAARPGANGSMGRLRRVLSPMGHPKGSRWLSVLCLCLLQGLGCADDTTVETDADAVNRPNDAARPHDTGREDPDGRVFADPPDSGQATDSGLDLGGEQPDAAALPDDAAPTDAGVVQDADPMHDAAPFEEGPARYPSGRDLSPITPHVVERLQAIAANGPLRDHRVFAKVGASSTVSQAFMHCFDGGTVVLAAGDGAPFQATIDHFLAGDAGGTSPYRRESESAVVGWSARSAIAGDPSPLQTEVDTINPRFALIMYGTNDIQSRTIDRYYTSLMEIADRLTAQGVIPAFSSIMPRDDDPDADLWVPAYNAVVRGVAESHQVPFMDLHRNLLPLPGHGLGRDRLHSSAAPAGACTFDNDGLQHGYNWRNLLALRTLQRLKAVLLDGADAPDAPQPAREAAGTFDDPIPIDTLPFVDHRDSRRGVSHIDGYPACDSGQDESGPEHIYHLRLDAPAVLRAIVLDRGDVDVDVHLLSSDRTCLDRAHTDLSLSLDAGDWYVSVDTYVGAAGDERGGDYLFVVVAD